MTPDQILAESAVTLAHKVVAALATSDDRLSEIARKQALAQAKRIIEFDHARRQTVIQGPWGRNNTEPTGAA